MKKSIARIDLPYPCFNPADHFLTGEVLDRARKHFEEFVHRYQIKVHRHRSGLGGKAAACYKTIWIPKIWTLGDFWVCMHEVGHILSGTVNFLPPASTDLILEEYKAEMFALVQCQALGLSTEYERHAKRNVFKYVKRTHATGIQWLELPQLLHSILPNWLGIHVQDWQAGRIELVEK